MKIKTKMKLYDPLKQSTHLLKSGGLNLRERLNIYAGMIGGVLAPIIATRYLVFGFGSEENLGAEAIKWAYSLPAAVLSPITLAAGAALGNYSAKTNREIREEKERREGNLGKILGI